LLSVFRNERQFAIIVSSRESNYRGVRRANILTIVPWIVM